MVRATLLKIVQEWCTDEQRKLAIITRHGQTRKDSLDPKLPFWETINRTVAFSLAGSSCCQQDHVAKSQQPKHGLGTQLGGTDTKPLCLLPEVESSNNGPRSGDLIQIIERSKMKYVTFQHLQSENCMKVAFSNPSRWHSSSIRNSSCA